MKKLSLILVSLIIIVLLNFHFNKNYKNYKNFTTKGNAKVIDGDTIKINGDKIRFGGIDAPETNYLGKQQMCYHDQNEIVCGKLSTEKLIEKIDNNIVSCKQEKNNDNYGRIIAECFVNKESLSKFMVRSGYAFDYPKYSKKKYAEDEEYARNNNLGIWNMKFEYPWNWRKKIREGKNE